MTEGEISENGGGGLAVSSQGKGRWEQVHFIANKGDAVLVSDGGRPDAEAMPHRGGGRRGPAISSTRPRASSRTSKSSAAAVPAVEIEGGANPSLRHVKRIARQGGGIVVQALGGGTADHCQMQRQCRWRLAAGGNIAAHAGRLTEVARQLRRDPISGASGKGMLGKRDGVAGTGTVSEGCAAAFNSFNLSWACFTKGESGSRLAASVRILRSLSLSPRCVIEHAPRRCRQTAHTGFCRLPAPRPDTW